MTRSRTHDKDRLAPASDWLEKRIDTHRKTSVEKIECYHNAENRGVISILNCCCLVHE